MGFGEILYTALIRPLQMLFEIIYMVANSVIDNPGLSIVALSLAMNFLVLPLYRRADAMQEEERDTEARLRAGIAHIKKTFKGDERMLILSTYYRQNNYKPTDVFKGSVSLFLEIPFFIAAYQFLSHLSLLEDVSFGPIRDLSQADGLIMLGGVTINLLPIIMTGVNLISCVIFTKGYPLKTKIQLYSMAAFFFVFLYGSPSGLVFYWTLNNIFSLVKTIFYKLKNPAFVLKVMGAIAGFATIVFAFGFFNVNNLRYKLVVAVFGVALIVPLIADMFKSKRGNKSLSFVTSPKVMTFCGLYLSIMLGMLIPSNVIVSSPQEFVDVNMFVHPVWYIVSAALLGIGFFVIWLGVFYRLAGEKAKIIFEAFTWIYSVVATVDYMVFSKNFGILSSTLFYWDKMIFTTDEFAKNGLAVVFAVVISMLIFWKLPKFIPRIAAIGCVAFIIMTATNISSINEEVAKIDLPEETTAESAVPEIKLSKTGKNVIVFMLDRSMNGYMPYIFNEKPELKEAFDGFTYYSNVISFGGFTNFGTPALFGGYEYTPFEMNKRDKELLKDKQNEALSVLPTIFDQNGYEITIIDPIYANYKHVNDFSIFNDKLSHYNGYSAMGTFTGEATRKNRIAILKRNFFCYSFMKSLPTSFQPLAYDDGHYWKSSVVGVAEGQAIRDSYSAVGINNETMDTYSVLEKLPEITTIEDNGDNFLMMVNNTTHEPMMFQEPEYLPSMNVNNYDYEASHGDRFVIDGKKITVENEEQRASYQTNVASMIQIANWLDYMKANGVYDNTRIIIVADHGKNLGSIEGAELPGDQYTIENEINSIEAYYPTLMVKDFNSAGFTRSEEFMTNGDVPTLAVDSIIDNPVNPYTGKALNNDEKYAHDQYILSSIEWSIDENNGTQYKPGSWYKVHDNMLDVTNWELVNSDSTTPIK